MENAFQRRSGGKWPKCGCGLGNERARGARTGQAFARPTIYGLAAQTIPRAHALVVTGTTLINDSLDALLDCTAEGGSGYHFFDKSAERVTLRAAAPRPGGLPDSTFCSRFH